MGISSEYLVYGNVPEDDTLEEYRYSTALLLDSLNECLKQQHRMTQQEKRMIVRDGQVPQPLDSDIACLVANLRVLAIKEYILRQEESRRV